jgi:hypothetical protein
MEWGPDNFRKSGKLTRVNTHFTRLVPETAALSN